MSSQDEEETEVKQVKVQTFLLTKNRQRIEHPLETKCSAA